MQITAPLLVLGLLLVRYESLFAYFPSLIISVIIAYILHQSFRWEIVGIQYRGAFLLVFSLFFVVSIVRNYEEISSQFFLAGIGFAIMIVATLWGWRCSLRGYPDIEDGLKISSPFVNTKWVVSQGGHNSILNAHRVVDAQSHALDFVVFDESGVRAKSIWSRNLSDYYSFGTSVYAPCDGLVANVCNTADDLPLGTTDEDSPFGNFILLHCQGSTLLIAHLMKGSIEVEAGTEVLTGRYLARIGNSGNTTEPHLHIHSVRGNEMDEEIVMSTGKPLPLIVDGQYLQKGDNAGSW